MLITGGRYFDYEAAKQLQLQLSKLVRIDPVKPDSIEIIVATDNGYKGSKVIGVAVAYNAKKRKELCHIAIVDEVEIPYIPGLLAFREAPLMIEAIKELSLRCVEADIIMVNGHGLSHPRRFGIASHVGIALDKPSIGIAKRLLYGSITTDNNLRTAITVGGAVVGYVLENVYGGKVFVSVGHKVKPEDALIIVDMVWNRSNPLPDPLYIADNLTKKMRLKI
ncbi:MAG: endonuclease V [Ignisphaera sp.]